MTPGPQRNSQSRRSILGTDAVVVHAALGAGLMLSPEACRVLYALAMAGLQARQASAGGGAVPPGTAHLLTTLRTGSRIDAGQGGSLAAIVEAGTGLDDAQAVLAAQSPHEFSTSQAAEVWGMTPSYVRRLARKGKIPARDTGRGWLVPAEYVLRTHHPRETLRSAG